jgi:vitamin B12 transporter
MKISRLTAFSLFVIFSSHYMLLAQDSVRVYQLDKDIIVTANRVPTAFNDVARAVTVITNSEIQSIAAQSVPELLENVLGVDVKQRGTQGIQADISVRGAGFEQTLVLIDGTKISDPQTGHHNMDLPLHISDIERIEILKGPGSRLYGPNAFGGVINIITKKASESSATFGASLGENNLYDSYVNLYYPFTESSHKVSLAKGGSDGYRPNTDFQSFTFSHNSIFNFDKHKFSISTGYNQKDFGANSFYTTAFPDQYEKTRIFFLQSGISLKYDDFSIKPLVYYRKHNDDFLLRRNDPSFYHNKHKTDVFGIDIQGIWKNALGSTLFSTEWAEEAIDSNNLGNHKRNRSGLSVQQQLSYSGFLISAGLSAYKYSGEEWQSWPGLDIAFKPVDQLKIYGSIARGFRVPTYTELYYNGGGLSGNSKLKAEKSTNYEAGISWMPEIFHVSLAVFQRDNDNLIDYVQNPADSVFYARNFTKTQTKGIEADLEIKLPLPYIDKVYIKYSQLDLDVDIQDKITRYTLTNYKQQFFAGTRYQIPGIEGLSQSWKIRYEERLQNTEYTTIDSRISWQDKNLRIYLDVTNLLDKKYEDIPGVPMPGRWFKLGFEYNLMQE